MGAISSIIPRKRPKNEERIKLSGEVLYYEILARLPAKSLMRFRSVCKSWSSVMRDPSFVKAHHRHFSRFRNDHAHLFLTTAGQNAKHYQHFFSIQINQSGEPSLPTHILTLPAPSFFSFRTGSHSVNGLFLISDSSSQSENVLMINPCTKEVVNLPHADQVATATDGSVVHRLGISALTDQYKVLRVHQTGKEVKFKILTLSTRSWRDLDLEFSHLHPLGPRGFCFTERSVWLRGGMHWLHWNRNVVVVFDFEDEKLRVIPLPSLEPDSAEWESVIEVNGCLAVWGKGTLVNNKKMHIFMYRMEDYQNHVWVKEEAIEFNDLWSRRVLGTIDTGDLLLSSSDGDIDLYNFKNKRWCKAKITLPKGIGICQILGSYDENIQPLT